MDELNKFRGALILLIVVGFPVIPIINLPFAIFLFPFYRKEILDFFLGFKLRVSLFIFLAFIYVVWSFIVFSEMADLIFSFKLLFKILISIIAAIVVFDTVSKNQKSLNYWIILQFGFTLFSIFNENFYSILTIFISANSRETFEEIFGFRSIGFGIYHVEGAILYVFLSNLKFIIREKSGITTGSLKYLSFISLTMSRSSVIFLFLIYFFKKPFGLVLLIGLSLFLSRFISEDDGALYWAFELFINLSENSNLATTSTDANKDMLVFPDFRGLILGDGKFFQHDGLFYMSTDLGISRLLFFGGVPYLMFFLFLNLIFIGDFWLSKRYLVANLIICGLFLLLNFKGIFICVFYIVILNLCQKNRLLIDGELRSFVK